MGCPLLLVVGRCWPSTSMVAGSLREKATPLLSGVVDSFSQSIACLNVLPPGAMLKSGALCCDDVLRWSAKRKPAVLPSARVTSKYRLVLNDRLPCTDAPRS